jgi:hypothetical protein
MTEMKFFTKGRMNVNNIKKIIINHLQMLYEQEYEYKISISESTLNYNDGEEVKTVYECSRIIDFTIYENEDEDDLENNYCELIFEHYKDDIVRVEVVKIDWDVMITCNCDYMSSDGKHNFTFNFNESDLSRTIIFEWNN